MSDPEKYFIVAPGIAFGDWADYDATIQRYGLDPGRCFACASMVQAVCDVTINKMQGLNASVWTSAGRVGTRRELEEAA
jgi:hypothetical protein